MSQIDDWMLDRRAVLGGGLAGFAALAVGTLTGVRPFFERRGLPIGLQLYTLGEIVDTDLEGALEKVARIGFKAIELAGFRADQADVIRAAADRAALHITSVHLGVRSEDGQPGISDDAGQLATSIHTLGAAVVVLPEPVLRYSGDKALPATLDDWKRTAAFLNERGNALRREGLMLAYHNHNPEFAPVEGTTGFDVIARETDRKLVTFEMDAGWVRAAGLDPVSLIERYPGRFRLMHIKDVTVSTRTNFELSMDSTEVGHGIINWRRLIAAAYKAGITQYFVEQEPPFKKDRFDSIADSFAFLSSMP